MAAEERRRGDRQRRIQKDAQVPWQFAALYQAT
jgi:hypothetical protein